MGEGGQARKALSATFCRPAQRLKSSHKPVTMGTITPANGNDIPTPLLAMYEIGRLEVRCEGLSRARKEGVVGKETEGRPRTPDMYYILPPLAVFWTHGDIRGYEVSNPRPHHYVCNDTTIMHTCHVVNYAVLTFRISSMKTKSTQL